MDISRVDTRLRLKARRDPYWKKLTAGNYVGFRKMTAGATGTWLARFYNGERYKHHALGDFATLSEKERYDAAKVAADDWFRHLNLGGSTESKNLTVKDACAAYVDYLRQEKSAKAADDAKGRFTRLIDDDPLGRIKLQKLAPLHLAEWKERILNAGSSHIPLSSRASSFRASFNRNATSLRAALNLAFQRGYVTSKQAWAKELKPLKDACNSRELNLNKTQLRKLINKASDELRPYLMSLFYLPFRPGEVASLKVENLDLRAKILKVPAGKTGARVMPLAGDALTHFKSCAKDKLPSAWLISRADGRQWKKEAWGDAIKEAATLAKLPPKTCAYTFRHSVITDLVTDGTDLFTIAKISGTSVAMIEKHYGKFQLEHARAALESRSL